MAARARVIAYSCVLLVLFFVLIFLLVNTAWDRGASYLIGALIIPGVIVLVMCLILPDFLRALKGKR